MSWTTPRIWVVGEIISAAKLNEISNDENYLYNVSHIVEAHFVPTSLWSTSSTTFIDWGNLNVTFTKRGGVETSLFVDINTTLYFDPASALGLAQYGIRIGSTDYSNFLPHYPPQLNATFSASETIPIAGLAAGVYTLYLRIKTLDPTCILHADGNDFMQFLVQEANVT